MIEALKDFLFPKLCICGEPVGDGSSVCPDCWQKLDFITSNICSKCGFPHEHDFGDNVLCPSCISKSPQFDLARSVFRYNDFSGRLITLLKYADKTHYVEMLSRFLASEIRKNDAWNEFDFITSVPMNRLRLLKRKYNQSALLANRVSVDLAIPANNLLLHRIKSVPPQTGLKRKDRMKNIKGAFAVTKKFEESLKGARVILVDDVYTTGATLNECSNVLKRAGVTKIFCVTLARTLLN